MQNFLRNPVEIASEEQLALKKQELPQKNGQKKARQPCGSGLNPIL